MNGLLDFADSLGAWVLPGMVALPLVAALVLVSVRRIGDEPAPEIAVVAASGTLLLAVLAAAGAAPYGTGRPEISLDVPWVPALGMRFHLALDGISAPLVLLTALLGLLVCWHVVRVQPPAGRARLRVASYLAVEGGALLTFTAQDVILFFLAFEVVLVPMWFVIALWGDDHSKPFQQPPFPPRPGGEAARRDAANRFILFTALGSAVMLIGLLLVALSAGTTDLQALAVRAGKGLGSGTQVLAATLIVFGLAIKVPAFGGHTWLPPAHTIAPTGGSVLLAGVLLKMGSYGLVRVAVPIVPDGVRTIAPLLAALGIAGILWAGLACFVQTDLKRLIALSSVAHMGFVLLGTASMTPQGLQGALFANVAHGLITGLLFLTVGALKDRHHSADLAVIGPALRDRLPRLGWLLAFGAIAGLGLPGLAGFWGELLAIIGSWNADTPGGALSGLGKPFAVAAAVGTVIAAAYLLRVLRLIWHGARVDVPATADVPTTADVPATAVAPASGDATTHELLVASPLVILTVALGIMPWLLLDLTGPAVRLLLLVPGVTP